MEVLQLANKLQKVVNKSKNKKQTPVPVKIVNEAGPDTIKSDDKWRARDALDTLRRAAEIKNDKPLMRAAKAEAKAQMKILSNVYK